MLKIVKKIDFFGQWIEAPSRGVEGQGPILADFADFSRFFWQNHRFQGKTLGVLAIFSSKSTVLPRHSGVFSTPFARTRDARFRGSFSELHKLLYIQGMRKVGNVFGILFCPIWRDPRNWWHGWAFCVRKSRSWWESVTLGVRKCRFLRFFMISGKKRQISRVRTRSFWQTGQNSQNSAKWPILAISGHSSQNQPKTGQIITTFARNH